MTECSAYYSQNEAWNDIYYPMNAEVLDTEEIDYYIKNHQPFDKAGAYGIQEWIGQIGVQKIEGSYFTVMGMPVHLLYDELLKF